MSDESEMRRALAMDALVKSNQKLGSEAGTAFSVVATVTPTWWQYATQAQRGRAVSRLLSVLQVDEVRASREGLTAFYAVRGMRGADTEAASGILTLRLRQIAEDSEG
jgi:hypothetical protein